MNKLVQIDPRQTRKINGVRLLLLKAIIEGKCQLKVRGSTRPMKGLTIAAKTIKEHVYLSDRLKPRVSDVDYPAGEIVEEEDEPAVAAPPRKITAAEVVQELDVIVSEMGPFFQNLASNKFGMPIVVHPVGNALVNQTLIGTLSAMCEHGGRMKSQDDAAKLLCTLAGEQVDTAIPEAWSTLLDKKNVLESRCGIGDFKRAAGDSAIKEIIELGLNRKEMEMC